MFVFRSIFWLTALVLVLPPSQEGGPPPRVSLLESASALRVLAQDVSGVCERHPQACETSRETITLLGRKLETGRQVAAAAIASARQEGAEEIDTGTQVDTGTLTALDLDVPWTGEAADVAATIIQEPAPEPVPASATFKVGLPAPRPQLL